MIKLAEILSGLEAKISAMPGGIVIYAIHNKDIVGKLQVEWERDGVALVLAADANVQRQGVGTFLYEQLKEFLDGTGIQWIEGAVEGSGIVQIREKVFGPGNTHYFSGGGEISKEEAIHIMDVEFGRVIAKTKLT
jgi:GNAT superfamily N-acetyltransferase